MPKLTKELSALAVSKLAAPGLHFVGGVAGLALQINPAGARSWTLRAVIGGKRRDMGLGPFSPTGVTLAIQGEIEVPLPGSTELAALRLPPEQLPLTPLKVWLPANWCPISWAT